MPEQEPIGPHVIFWMWMGAVIAGFAAMFVVLAVGR